MNKKLDKLLDLFVDEGEMGIEIKDLVLRYDNKKIHVEGNMQFKIEE
ncbi:hypothetical protein AMET1_1055 [Methanonatronarchaeum thermophilum]|uniref:Uncharacterized protein n=1 Tax=Methanonatronarchaeum thermophilum TaxID=1927129 RepID=A0A1Y3G9N3_9EURY|nr:hypothetical protein [Methanonatronarchaeum thermophilum]OUJ18152.1 hypothetical protein AMET1_1055 [Methanonatronarchaeum thermophilum]